MSEEVVGQGEVNILSGVEGGEPEQQANPSTDTTGTWMSNLPDEDVGYIQNKGWDKDDGVAKLFESYKNLESLRGIPEDRILKLPKEGDSLDDVYTALGRPESPGEYTYNNVEELGDSPIIEEMKQAAHEIGMSSSAFTKFTDRYNELALQEYVAQKEQIELQESQDVAEMKRELGGDFDRITAQADSAAIALGFDQETADALRGSLGVKKMLDVMGKISDAIGEDSVNTSANQSPYGKTKEQLKAEKVGIMAELGQDKQRSATFLKNAGADYLRVQAINEALLAD